MKTKSLLLGITLLAFYFRASGLFHGLDDGFIYHPDTPKQVANLEQGLHGTYIHYTGSYFTDGYPFGLNRIDELIIRSVRFAWSPIHHLLHGQGVSMALPNRTQLYAVVRVLRLLYGMVAFGLLAHISFRLFKKSFVPMCILFMAAVAPLSSTVTHAGSGDIGLDLFLCVTLVALTRYVNTPKLGYLILAGLSVGLAFACKYQGGMGAWVVGIFILLQSPPLDRKQAVQFLRLGMTAAFGFFAGVFLLTPGLWVDPSRTWKLMRQNMDYIKDYGVPPEVLELPLSTRIVSSLTQNIPVVAQALGLGLVALAGWSLLQAVRKKSRLPLTPSPTRLRAFWVSVASFPFVVIVISTAMKPMVQPFHFSFLLFPLVLTAGFVLNGIQQTFHRSGIFLVSVLTILVSGASLHRSLQEDDLWRKPGVTPIHTRYATHSTLQPLDLSRDIAHTHEIKSFYLHPPGLPVFRNQRRVAVSNHATWWNTNRQLPLPTRPLFDEVPEWIFLNGPFFPNNDHAFRLDAGEKSTVYLVQEKEARDTLQLGVRSGARPTRIHGKTGEFSFSATLPPHSQEILTLYLTNVDRTFPADTYFPATLIYDLEIESSTGPVWVEVIRDDQQLLTYQKFGPGKQGDQWSLTDKEVQIWSTTRFLDSSTVTKVQAGEHPLFLQTEGLPAGSYDLNVSFINTGSKSAEMEVLLRSPYERGPTMEGQSIKVAPGHSAHQLTFHKPFTPFEVQCVLLTSNENLLLEKWSFRPSSKQQIPLALPKPAPDFHPLALSFEQGPKITGLAITVPETKEGEITWSVRSEIPTSLSEENFLKSVIFIHILDKDGSIFQTLDIPLVEATFGDQAPQVHRAPLSGSLVSLNSSSIRVGVYHSRTFLRSKPSRGSIRSENVRVEKDSYRLLRLEPILKMSPRIEAGTPEELTSKSAEDK